MPPFRAPCIRDAGDWQTCNAGRRVARTCGSKYPASCPDEVDILFRAISSPYSVIVRVRHIEVSRPIRCKPLVCGDMKSLLCSKAA